MSGQHMSAKGAQLINLQARKPLSSSGTTNTIISSTGNPVKPAQICFNRVELNAILRIYGFKVADGEWRDYAIDHLKDKAVFSVFRKSAEAPIYRIEKDPRLSRKQGAYSVVAHTGAVLKRGHDIAQVLKVFEKRLQLVE